MNLLDLPAEIQSRIFRFYFEGRRLRWEIGPSYFRRSSWDHLSLLFLCRQIYDESWRLMLGVAQIDITNAADLHYGVLHTSVFGNDMSILRDVYVSIEFRDSSYADVLRRMPSLRTFTFSYDSSAYWFDTALSCDEISKADLDFIEEHPERILGDDYDMSSDIGPLNDIELHAIGPLTDRTVTVWKQQKRFFKLIAEFAVFYDDGTQFPSPFDLTEVRYGVRSPPQSDRVF